VRRRALLAQLAFAATAGSGCASLVPRQVPPDLAGRLAVRVEATATTPTRSFAADFDLSGNADSGTLRLTGPLGAMLAEVRWQPGSAQLTDAQGTRGFATLDAMAQALFGEVLPLAALTDWLRGRPWPGAPSRLHADGFEQLGWVVALADFDQGLMSASRERAPAVSVRARLERPA
jgi:outer membrane lipoprotein LolB